jgi:GTPase
VIRYPSSKPSATGANNGATSTSTDEQYHSELNEILDSLDLTGAGPRVLLKDLLLGHDSETLEQLQGVIAERLLEGHGEAVFDIGFENSGESMKLTKEEFDTALKRLLETATLNRAHSDLLLTKNVGGEVEATSTQTKQSKDKDCSGKILIRKIPATVEDVIETRIAVVGNGELSYLTKASGADH